MCLSLYAVIDSSDISLQKRESRFGFWTYLWTLTVSCFIFYLKNLSQIW